MSLEGLKGDWEPVTAESVQAWIASSAAAVNAAAKSSSDIMKYGPNQWIWRYRLFSDSEQQFIRDAIGDELVTGHDER